MNQEQIDREITEQDLELIYIRAQDSYGKWWPVNLDEATDAQFDHWVRERIVIYTDWLETSWPTSERVRVLNILRKTRTIYMLKKDGE